MVGADVVQYFVDKVELCNYKFAGLRNRSAKFLATSFLVDFVRVTMEIWTKVKARRKDPGGSGGAQEGKEKDVEEDEVQEGSTPRFTSKIRAEFVHNGRNGSFKASAEAKQLCGHFLKVDPNIVFKAESDTSVKFNKMTEFPTGNKFKEFFPITSYTRNDGSGKVQINLLIESDIRLSALKRDMTMMKFLRERKIWLTEHKYETHALQAIGYIVKKSPVLTHRPQLESDIKSAFADHVDNTIGDEDFNFVPEMEIGSKKIVHVLREGDKKTGVMETQALEVRCESAHAQRLKKLFFSAGLSEEKFGKFVPYELIKNDQSIVKSLINEHNKLLSEISVISSFGLTRMLSTLWSRQKRPTIVRLSGTPSVPRDGVFFLPLRHPALCQLLYVIYTQITMFKRAW